MYAAMGNAIGILVGQLLGAGKLEEARDTDTKLIAFAVVLSAFMGVVLWLFAPLLPAVYNTSDSVKELATSFMRVAATAMPINSFVHASYFTLRSGGKTFVTFLFDGVYLWSVNFTTAFILSRFTAIPIVPLYFVCQIEDILKCAIGFILIKKGIWINNLVEEKEQN